MHAARVLTAQYILPKHLEHLQIPNMSEGIPDKTDELYPIAVLIDELKVLDHHKHRLDTF
jgi:hypothetical protein